jgi:hypothetical protein
VNSKSKVENVEWFWRIRVCQTYLQCNDAIGVYIRELVSDYRQRLVRRTASLRDQLYLIGKGMDCLEDFREGWHYIGLGDDEAITFAVDFYRQIANRCRMAVIYALICGRLRMGRDLAGLIARHVHATRGDIGAWTVTKRPRKRIK